MSNGITAIDAMAPVGFTTKAFNGNPNDFSDIVDTPPDAVSDVDTNQFMEAMIYGMVAHGNNNTGFSRNLLGSVVLNYDSDSEDD
jgi:hypothetical protein